MPILAGIQRRNYRIGQIKAGDKDEKGLPRRLAGFRFTTHAANVAAEVAEFFGGEKPRPWGRQWEVYTKVSDIAIALPPGDLVISQAMMRWSGGGPTMVCDGVNTSQPERGPCQCPQPDDPSDPDSVWEAINKRRKLAGQKTPRGCYPYTWINVCLPDIGGGSAVWQLLSKSENAAAEIIQQAELLERARAAGQYLPARLALEYREARVDGMLRQYNVPVLRVDASIRAIANGEFAGRSLADQLPPAPGAPRLALTAGSADRPAPVPRQAPARHMTAQEKAQDIADRARKAATRAEIEQLDAEAETEGVGDDNVCTWPEEDVYEELRTYLRARWKELPAGGAAA